MTIAELNALPAAEAQAAFARCCGSSTWASQMVAARPFANADALGATANQCWASCTEPDFLEAFSHHPKIGDVKELEKKFAATAAWSSDEQGSAVADAQQEVLHRLKDQNEAYEQKFGFIFIVCASGKSAAEMLQLLEARLPNTRATELQNAAEEQRKITQLRLNKLLEVAG